MWQDVPLFFMLPEFKPVVAMTILAGVAFGGETGFLVGAMTMLVSNMLFSQGPWTPWQMFAMGVNRLAGRCTLPKGRPAARSPYQPLHLRRDLRPPSCYGGIMNPASALMWAQHDQLENHFRATISPAFRSIWCAPVATFFFLWLGAEPDARKARPHQNEIRSCGVKMHNVP